MKICLIAEGSYPYVMGGVSSWIQMLMNAMPDHEFVIYAIGAEKAMKGQFKYDLPPNLLEIQEVFLDTFHDEVAGLQRNYKLSAKEKEAVKSLLTHRDTDWDQLFSLFTDQRIDSVSGFVSSRDLFDIVREVCEEHYQQIPFTEFFWSVRSMLLPLLALLKHKVPEADLYHSVATGYGGVVGAYGQYLYEKPYILTEHGIYTREREEEIIKADWIKGNFKDLWIAYFHSLSMCAYKASDQVISLFNRNRLIQEEIGCDSGKISIIPNGVHPDEFLQLKTKENDQVNQLLVGAIVRVVPIKDIKTMIQSFDIVKRYIPHAVFYIFGPYDEDPEYYRECRDLVRSLGTEDIIFTGQIAVRDYLGKMDLLVLSSISEGQPLAILEGLAAGKPFVSTDVGSCRELLYGSDDGIGPAGRVVPVMHYGKMAEAIIEIGQDEKLRVAMGENGRKRVMRHYTKDQFISSYRQIYESRGVLQWQA
ncbi:GT4 family glycosyltransferase PelF [Jeotgalibacillus terrae]|uniref:GT4 family glycosyltransferase PelF n=1 Tax=Jeotgalibacillus terrae TaxID=587735 RepID=A0ABW5ZE80_9BACL|nr:GT4 family glycosyltransferase PelF [Jeotgalibacillus terrae]MBM7579214.1 glycosyltransferase involved in cell wall biosynthesis [Jeotgalibacillus terrae]